MIDYTYNFGIVSINFGAISNVCGEWEVKCRYGCNRLPRLIPFRYTKLIESKSTEEGIILGNIHFHMASIYRYKRMYKQSECSACSALDHRKLYTGIFIVYICMSKCMPSNSLY